MVFGEKARIIVYLEYPPIYWMRKYKKNLLYYAQEYVTNKFSVKSDGHNKQYLRVKDSKAKRSNYIEIWMGVILL